METCETLIVSDIHLGSPMSLASDLLRLLENSQFKRLILLGDIFQDLDFSRLTKEHWSLISYIRKLSNPKRGVEVVWVEGNHDSGITEVMEHLIGVPVYIEYTWDWNGKKCLAVHGHQYDSLCCSGTGIPLIGRIFMPIYLQLQKMRFIRRSLSKVVDVLHAVYERLPDRVAEGALADAHRHEAKFVFCGHTHQAEHRVRNGIEYWNTGDWAADRGSYVALYEDGTVSQKEYVI